MQLLRGFDNSQSYRGGYVAIGNFDGVHRGHRKMIDVLVRLAREENVPATVLTFDPHPIHLLRPAQAPPRLSTVERKAELFAALGVDFVIAYPTDRALLNLTPDEFFDQIVLGQLDARGLVEGPNFFFGHDRAGDVHVLRTLCDRAGRSLHVVEPVVLPDGQLVSSSLIRQHILHGEIRRANEMLGEPYRLQGTVVAGEARGRRLGVPTANLADIETLLPAVGVYAAFACPQAGDVRAAAVHIGPNVTFGDDASKVEVHLLDYDGDLYGQRLSIDLIDRVRGTRRFTSPEELQQQLAQDLEQVRRMIDNHSAARQSPQEPRTP